MGLRLEICFYDVWSCLRLSVLYLDLTQYSSIYVYGPVKAKLQIKINKYDDIAQSRIQS